MDSSPKNFDFVFVTHPHVVLNLYDMNSSENTKENCFIHKESHWGPKQHWRHFSKYPFCIPQNEEK